MDLWSRIPIVTLMLSPACRKENEPDWPPSECGEVTCPAGEVCVVDPNDCDYVDDPCWSDETTSDGPETCIRVEPGPRHCEAVPAQCKWDPSGIGTCLEDSGHCPWIGNEFEDGLLRCRTGYYGECGIDGDEPRHPYCGYCLHDDEASVDFDDLEE